jgi:putative peptidoglycan lipid II flippase
MAFNTDESDAATTAGVKGAQVAKDSLVISAFTALGVGSGLLVDALVAAKYGMGATTDALFIALTIPQLLSSILDSATLPVMVPLFSKTRLEDGEEENWRLFSNLANLSGIIMMMVSVLGILGSPLLMLISAPGLDAASRDMVISLNRILFLTLTMAGVVEVMKAMLNSYHRFAFPAAALVVQYLTIALSIVLLQGHYGVHAIAIGYVLGSVVQVLMLGAALAAMGVRYYPVLDISHPTVRQAGRLFGPLLAAEAMGQSSIWAERLLASFLPTGGVSALVYARRVLRALTLAMVSSVSSALLPRFSALAGSRDLKALRRSVNFGIRLTLLICVPVAAWVMVVRIPLVSLLFQRGAFDEQAVFAAASVVLIYMLGLPFMALWQLVLTPFYALGDTRTPLNIRAAGLVLLLLLEVTLAYFSGVQGLAMALSLSRVACALGTHYLLRRRIGEFDQGLVRYALKLVLAAGIMAMVVAPALNTIEHQLALPRSLKVILQLGSAGILGPAVYMGSLVLLRVREVGELFDVAKGRLLGRFAYRANTDR